MLSPSGVLCNFSGMLQDFPDSVMLGMGTGEKGSWRYGGGGGEEKENQVSPYITALAVVTRSYCN